MNYSILTTLYKNDSPEYLKQSIDSMLEQTVLTDDYVIVADGPLTPELDSVLASYAGQYPFINLVRLPENGGLGVALREGLKHCKNELVARLDADDLSMPERCEMQLSLFEKEDDLAMVGSDMLEFADDPNVISDRKKMPTEPDEIYRYGKRRNPFNHSSVMYKKSVIESVGSYSTMRRSQDVELWSKLLYAGHKCRNIGIPLIKFRCGDTRVKRKKKWSNVKSDLKIFRNNYKMGYAGFFDYMYVCITQIGFFILPSKLAGYLYMKLFRSKANQETK
ncbi:MAG: glycosyltransferase [Clostridia bacterium]|nr:glycosyltransferase [Clostridia bacterium]